MRRNKDHQERQQADQIEVIQVLCLVEQEYISKGHEKQHGTRAIPRAEQYAQRRYGHDAKMPIHSVTGPRLDPAKPIVSEVELGCDIIGGNPVVGEISINLD